MKKNKLLITLIQTNIYWLDKQKNLQHLTELISNIETDIVILPEMFNTGFHTQPQDVAEDETGPTSQWMRHTAQANNTALIGSLIWHSESLFFNRLIFMRPDGQWAWYDKRHLFSMAGEHKKFTSGNKQVIINYLGWKIKPLICYDLRFPVWARNNQDYHLLIYVANWPQSRIEQWKNLLIARAIENQAYVIAVNRIGQDGNNFLYSGLSLAINPKGEILHQSPENKEDITTIEIDLDQLISMRKKFPVLLDKDNFKIEKSQKITFW